jgi:hypothetical protein
MPAPTVLEQVLDETGLPPEEYFQRLEDSLEEARQQRVQRMASSRDTAAFITAETSAAPTLPEEAAAEEPPFTEPGEEELVPSPGPARPRARKSRPRPAREVSEEEEELAEYGLEPLEDEESQFRQAYRRAVRGTRRPRER